MPFAVALSEHPVTAHAVGEVAGQVLEEVGAGADLALLFVTPPHAGALEDAAAAVRTVLRPGTLLGCAAESVVGGDREVEGDPAVVLWAGHVGAVRPVRLEAFQTPAGDVAFSGWPDPADLPFQPRALVLLADPYSFAADALFAHVSALHPGLPVSGGMASAARGPGGNRLALDGEVVTSGAVGALLGPSVAVETFVSQGCRPIGEPYVVTRGEGNIVYELAGRPALERLAVLVNSGRLSSEEVDLIQHGLHLGRAIDEHKAEFGAGDFLVRNVLGADQQNGAIAVADEVDVGTTVQYHVRDADTADEELRSLLSGRSADAALVFTCNGRGTRLFPEPHHDASVVSGALGGAPVAGFFAQGEFGPVGGRNFVHGFTASVALLGGPPA